MIPGRHRDVIHRQSCLSGKLDLDIGQKEPVLLLRMVILILSDARPMLLKSCHNISIFLPYENTL